MLSVLIKPSVFASNPVAYFRDISVARLLVRGEASKAVTVYSLNFAIIWIGVIGDLERVDVISILLRVSPPHTHPDGVLAINKVDCIDIFQGHGCLQEIFFGFIRVLLFDSLESIN